MIIDLKSKRDERIMTFAGKAADAFKSLHDDALLLIRPHEFSGLIIQGKWPRIARHELKEAVSHAVMAYEDEVAGRGLVLPH